MKFIRRFLTILWRITKWLGYTLLALISMLLLVYGYKASQRAPRHPETLQLQEGITYSRHIKSEPARAVWHVVKLDLTQANVELFTTPPDRISKFNHLKARTTTQFAEEFEADIAINASFFFPIVYNPFEFYPRVGDLVSSVGLTISDGIEFSPEDDKGFHTFCILPANIVIQDTGCPESTVDAVSGNMIFLREGKANAAWDNFDSWRYGRTVVAIDDTGQQLWLLVVDGQQPEYSRGMTFAELADFLIGEGATTALNLDGGGSATLVINGQLFSSPIQNRIPMHERPVANHLGIRILPSD